MMNPLLLLISLVALWALSPATCANTPTHDCPKGRIGPNNGDSMHNWSLCTVVRLFDNGRPLELPGPVASRNPNDSQLDNTLRFGALYLVPSQRFFRTNGWVQCVQGRDTMRILVEADASHNCLIDSIPFKPGFFVLSASHDTKWENWQVMPRPEKVSLAPYYRQRKAALAQDNPFTGYCFHDRPAAYGPRSPKDSTPVVPTEVFSYLLNQRVYYRRNDVYRLRPLPYYTRAELARLGAFR